ncbi:MAG TPA: SigE family RNA polymerase sigma factor [Trebonia sp.]|nr:SigE family RNA polymerase sigma factor [Trebonia sp.]
MRRERRDSQLEAFLAERGNALMRTAYLLTSDRPAAEDLFQEALERLLRNWHRVEGDPEAYLRRTLYNLAVDGWRRKQRRPEVLGLPEVAAPTDHMARVDLRLALVSALGQLPPRQRAALVARYWEGLSELETAELLGCSLSAVKSATSRALKRLRDAITPEPVGTSCPGEG